MYYSKVQSKYLQTHKGISALRVAIFESVFKLSCACAVVFKYIVHTQLFNTFAYAQISIQLQWDSYG